MDEVSEVTNPGRDKTNITWEEFHQMVFDLAERILKKELHIDNIYGIPRGGHMVAVCLSHILNLPIIEKLDQTYNTLIVDDICDGGRTLVRELYNRSLLTATLFVRVDETTFTPDVYVEDAKKEWIVFPWEVKDE